MKHYKVTILSGIGILTKSYDIHCKDFEELKKELLKRFGNVVGTRKADTERERVKSIIRNAQTIEDLEREVTLTHWNITIWEM